MNLIYGLPCVGKHNQLISDHENSDHLRFSTVGGSEDCCSKLALVEIFFTRMQVVAGSTFGTVKLHFLQLHSCHVTKQDQVRNHCLINSWSQVACTHGLPMYDQGVSGKIFSTFSALRAKPAKKIWRLCCHRPYHFLCN